MLNILFDVIIDFEINLMEKTICSIYVVDDTVGVFLIEKNSGTAFCGDYNITHIEKLFHHIITKNRGIKIISSFHLSHLFNIIPDVNVELLSKKHFKGENGYDYIKNIAEKNNRILKSIRNGTINIFAKSLIYSMAGIYNSPSKDWLVNEIHSIGYQYGLIISQKCLIDLEIIPQYIESKPMKMDSFPCLLNQMNSCITKMGKKKFKGWVVNHSCDINEAIQRQEIFGKCTLSTNMPFIIKINDNLKGIRDVTNLYKYLINSTVTLKQWNKLTKSIKKAIELNEFVKTADALKHLNFENQVHILQKVLREIICIIDFKSNNEFIIIRDTDPLLLEYLNLFEKEMINTRTDFDNSSNCNILQQKILEREKIHIIKLSKLVIDHFDIIVSIWDKIGYIDIYTSLSIYFVKNHYIKPILGESEKMLIQNGRHPLSEKHNYIPNSSAFKKSEERIEIIHGNATSGKTTYIKQVMILVFLSHIGLYIPAERAEIPIFDQIITLFQYHNPLKPFSSSFGEEMEKLSYILESFTSKSIIAIDDFGKTTSPVDGHIILKTLVQHLSNLGMNCPITIITTDQESIQMNKNIILRTFDIKQTPIITLTYKLINCDYIPRHVGAYKTLNNHLPYEIIARAEEISNSLMNNSDIIPKPALQNPYRFAPIKEAIWILSKWDGISEQESIAEEFCKSLRR